MARRSAFDLNICARPNILKLKPYRCARDDYPNDGRNVLLDANENAEGPSLDLDPDEKCFQADAQDGKGPSIDFLGLNRYPDPHQEELKEKFCRLRNTHHHTEKKLRTENMFCGVGSDEAIDALIRCFCMPGKEKILTCPPTYGMYAVSAQINDVEVVHVSLNVEDGFSLRYGAVNEKLSSDSSIKMVYICSPGNPTASLIRKGDIQRLLEHPTWNGIVIVDEAYIDFSPEGSSLAEWVLEWPNLVVMQTLSKAFGLAGIRLGVAFSNPDICSLLNNMKAPYNISSPTSVLANTALKEESLAVMRSNRKKILAQRERLLRELPKISGIGRFLGGTDSNFLLVEILGNSNGQPDNPTALAVYETMAANCGVVVRFRGKEVGCLGCLRITVGTAQEVNQFLDTLKLVMGAIHQKSLSNGVH